MTTLVTGGAGFIGSNLCGALLDEGEAVICLDNLSSGRRRNVEPYEGRESFSFVDGDIKDGVEQAVETAGVVPSTIDRIYHLASRASPVDFETHPLEIALTNSEGTHQVLEFASENDARVVYASTSEIYGEPEVHPQTEAYNGNVDLRGERACYDESKRFGETLTQIYHDEYGLDVRTVRIFNTYGPNMARDDGRVIPNFVTQALEGRDLTVYGDGSQTRSFLYVEDLLDGIRALMERDGLENAVVNVGSTKEITINDLATVVQEIAERDIDVVYESMPPGDPSRRQPDISRANELLGWSPTVGLREGLEQTFDYFARQDEPQP